MGAGSPATVGCRSGPAGAGVAGRPPGARRRPAVREERLELACGAVAMLGPRPARASCGGGRRRVTAVRDGERRRVVDDHERPAARVRPAPRPRRDAADARPTAWAPIRSSGTGSALTAAENTYDVGRCETFRSAARRPARDGLRRAARERARPRPARGRADAHRLGPDRRGRDPGAALRDQRHDRERRRRPRRRASPSRAASPTATRARRSPASRAATTAASTSTSAPSPTSRPARAGRDVPLRAHRVRHRPPPPRRVVGRPRRRPTTPTTTSASRGRRARPTGASSSRPPSAWAACGRATRWS